MWCWAGLRLDLGGRLPCGRMRVGRGRARAQVRAQAEGIVEESAGKGLNKAQRGLWKAQRGQAAGS